MQPKIFNPDTQKEYTETYPCVFCNIKMEQVSKVESCGILVTFENGEKGFYPKAVIKNWNLL